MTRVQRLSFWAVGFAIFALLVHLLNDILAPFIAGLAIAYFLDPLADKMEEKGCSRVVAVLIIMVSFFLILLSGLALLFPLLKTQVIAISERVPDILALLEGFSQQALAQIQALLPEDSLGRVMGKAREAATDNSTEIVKWFNKTLRGIWSGSLALFAITSMIIITPIVSFFMLLEWDNIIARADLLLPRKQAPTIRQQIRLIDQTISAFVRGQFSVCLVLIVWYSVTLSLIGLEAGLLIGLGAGLISFIPYVGAMAGIIVGVGIAIIQFDSMSPIAMVATIFLLGQIAESYVLTPRLVGDKVGLHDLWIIFALLAGGSLFGFVGVLLAIPTAAVIGVLIRFATAQYLKSPLYHGQPDDRTRDTTGEHN